ncbi:putative T7SS-secreted protein [Actinoalloteichus sp. GBA129-24]|uniref:putative T7SS-secreted protein n=1 Tax=Actinoalloteichus sp. GBA129-24 TaxID=1612551 RepID=UPI0009509B75|nr:hypothetical protein [Actinoalloteichus sp. GBA129-24]APU21125.1 hypothetical protein UA75_15580 [Actinoalloteichus sp. GBA129-24]
MGNPLVADVVDSTSSTSGLSLVESVNSTNQAIGNGDWLEAGLGTADLVMTALDPFAAIISNGVGWLIEHVGPLSDALDSLAGNPDEIRSHADTWTNVADEVNSVSTELGNLIQSDVTTWTGAAADAYRDRATDTANLILAAGTAAGGAADGIQKAGEVVSAVRDAVRDIIADVVGSMVSWALQVLFTLGIGLIWVVPKVVAKVAQTAAKIAQLITKLTTSMSKLTPLLKKLGDDFGTATNGLKNIKTSNNHNARSLDAPPVTPNGTRGNGSGDTAPPITPNGTDGPNGTSGGPDGTRGGPGISPNSTTPDASRGGPTITPDGTRGGPDGTRGLPGGDGSRSPRGGPAISPSALQQSNPMASPHQYTPGLGGPSTVAGPSAGPSVPTIQGVHFGSDKRPHRRTFAADSVNYHTLTDPSGRTLGVGFPSKSQDVYLQQGWANSNPYWQQAYHERTSTGYVGRPAPWANDPSYSGPFAALAHSNGKQYTVEAPTGRDGRMESVAVSPESYHKILTSNQVYQANMTGNENPLIAASCSTGEKGGAQRFADALHGTGDQRPVYAPTGVVTTGVLNNNGAHGVLAVDPVNTTTPGGFKRF